MITHQKKDKKKCKATVTFSRKKQKDEMLQLLKSPQLQNLMPKAIVSSVPMMVLWAVEYLYRLAVEGKIRIQVPMFEDESMEKKGLLDENARLKEENRRLRSANNRLLQSFKDKVSNEQ